jgi:hypothetical protein
MGFNTLPPYGNKNTLLPFTSCRYAARTGMASPAMLLWYAGYMQTTAGLHCTRILTAGTTTVESVIPSLSSSQDVMVFGAAFGLRQRMVKNAVVLCC